MLNNLLKRYESFSVAAKAAIWFVFCNVMQKGIATIIKILNMKEDN